MRKRLRRNRKSVFIRDLVQENFLTPKDLIAPFFVLDGENKQSPIHSMPDCFRLSKDLLLEEAIALYESGIRALALFPAINPVLKNLEGSEAYNPKGLIPETIRFIKKNLPEIVLIADVALDPYTSHGHDGIVNNLGEVDNDKTVKALCKQALTLAAAGADIVAPSDMMDGRIGAIRDELDNNDFIGTSILSYCAKYASVLYGPFRDALQSTLAFGDKKTYQMNPANRKEAQIEAQLDIEEGADMLLVKPASIYLDIISDISSLSQIPVGGYLVSGEYAMIMAAHEKGFLSADDVFYETHLAIKRAGGSFIFTYAAKKLLTYMKHKEDSSISYQNLLSQN